jgi:hypothetical protein
MAHWDFWAWLAYSGLWIGALVLFADGALKSASKVPKRWPGLRRIRESRTWSFVPVIFATLATLILLGQEFGWLKAAPKMEEVFNRTFNHETVELDNHRFFNCVFEDVTFTYRGGEYSFENATFRGRTDIIGLAREVSNTLRFAHFMFRVAPVLEFGGRTVPHPQDQ